MRDLELLYKSIPEVGEMYRSRRLSPVELTRLCLRRIEAMEPALNAFITVTAETALEQAGKAEQELASGVDRGPLHGVPVALKDAVDTAGVRTTCASRILRDNVPSRDAFIVRRLREAGAVMLGKTNMSEFGMGVAHPDYGQTNNPWDFGRTSGASSGGSTAAVASGVCFAAVGTDTGGSIRIPASYCGVAGFKPTHGTVSLEGVAGLAPTLDHAGPLARSSGDARLLLEAMTGQSFGSSVALRGLRLGVIQRSEKSDEPEVTRVFDAACQRLLEAGAEIAEVKIPDLEFLDPAYFAVLLPEAALLHARWMRERPDDYAPLTRAQLELGFALPAVTYARALRFRRHIVRQFVRALESVDVLISPTMPWVAPATDPVFTGEEGWLEGRRTVPHNFTGLPALSVNMGFGANGLPLGLQIIGKPRADAPVLGVGEALETLLPQGRPLEFAGITGAV